MIAAIGNWTAVPAVVLLAVLCGLVVVAHMERKT